MIMSLFGRFLLLLFRLQQNNTQINAVTVKRSQVLPSWETKKRASCGVRAQKGAKPKYRFILIQICFCKSDSVFQSGWSTEAGLQRESGTRTEGSGELGPVEALELPLQAALLLSKNTPHTLHHTLLLSA